MTVAYRGTESVPRGLELNFAEKRKKKGVGDVEESKMADSLDCLCMLFKFVGSSAEKESPLKWSS